MSVAVRIASLSASSGEHELVARVRRGDERAFEELYTRYRRRIAAYVLGMVGDHGRAEDVTQEVFISALRRMRETDRPIAFKPWIYEIAKNACIDHARRARRAQEVSLHSDDDLSISGLVPLSGTPTIETAVEAKQQLDDLRGAFGSLSESHHRLLVMRELEGRSYKEIAERTGMSRPVVESTLFRARRRLGEEYEELVTGRRCQQVQALCDRQPVRLGIRERRRLARHLSHCQPCRRHARATGFDDFVLKPTGVAGKIAALLPIPLIRFREAARGRTGRSVAYLPSWRSPAVARSMDTLTRLADPAAGSVGMGRAAAAVAAVAVITGAGGGLLVSTSATHPVRHDGPGSSPTQSALIGGGASNPGTNALQRYRANASASGASPWRQSLGQATGPASVGRLAASNRATSTSLLPMLVAPFSGALTIGAQSAGSPIAGLPGAALLAPAQVGLPAPPGLPVVPPSSSPTVPSAPNLLLGGSGSGLAGAPSGPELPGLPSIPNPPSGGSGSGPAGVPSVPELPRVPSLPKLPSPGSGSGSPGVPSLPKLPGLPSAPKLPSGGSGSDSGLPGVSSVPKLPGLPSVRKLPSGGSGSDSGLPGVPAVPKLPSGSPDAGLPTVPSTPKLPSEFVSKLPSGGSDAGLPTVPTAPKLPAAAASELPAPASAPKLDVP